MSIDSQEPLPEIAGDSMPSQEFDSNATALEQSTAVVATPRKKQRVRPRGSIIRCDILLPGEYETFIEWQAKQSARLSPHPGYISSAEEYHLFTHREPPAPPTPAAASTWSFGWRSISSIFWGAPKPKKPKKPYCGHALHPHARPTTFCPMCQVEHCFELLTLVAEKWTAMGAPFRDPERADTHPDYRAWKHAWLGARLELVQLVDKLEIQAIVQEKFGHSGISTKTRGNIDELRSARMALEYIKERYKFSLSGPAVPEEEERGEEDVEEGRARKMRRMVRFREDVKEPSGRRPKEFRRKVHRFTIGEDDMDIGDFESAIEGGDSRVEDDTPALEADDVGYDDTAAGSEMEDATEKHEDKKRDSVLGCIKRLGK